ncbi:MAG: hypothetical protein IT314_04175 [Anaerolineales bacterium]|nr:hypothetical protein [Anaerolineales bacterium]
MIYPIYNSTDTAIMVDDTGQLYIFSSHAKKVWTGKLEASDMPDTSVSSNNTLAQPIKMLARSNRSLLSEMGVSADAIEGFLKIGDG